METVMKDIKVRCKEFKRKRQLWRLSKSTALTVGPVGAGSVENIL